jgi:hypothetical protein
LTHPSAALTAAWFATIERDAAAEAADVVDVAVIEQVCPCPSWAHQYLYFCNDDIAAGFFEEGGGCIVAIVLAFVLRGMRHAKSVVFNK